MQGKPCFYLAIAVLLGSLLTACQQTINYPAPTLTGLSPGNINAGQPAFQLTITGHNLTPASTVNWNGPGTQTTVGVTLGALFQTTGSIVAMVPAALIQNPGSVSITVTNPSPGGGVSTPLTFTINATNSPVPFIASVSPNTATAGGGAFALFVTGSNFTSLSSAIVNGTAVATNFEGATSLQVSIPDSAVTSAGTIQLVIVNPPPGGGSSNTATIPVNNPVPLLAALGPTSGQAGSGATTLTLTGSAFVPTSVIMVNGSARATNFSSGTSISTLLNAGDFTAGQTSQIQVVNPAPGGGASNIVGFPVIPSDAAGLPVLVDVGPNGVQAANGICGGPSNCQSGAQGLTLKTSGPSISQTGEFVAFASISNNLVASQLTAGSEIFLRDTCLGGSSCTPATALVSVPAAGGVSNGSSSEPTISGDGSDVAYTSTATNLVNYVNVNSSVGSQVYWQPSSTSIVSPPVLVSIAADNVNPGNGPSYNPAISSDGRYVAFVSLATNLVTNQVVNTQFDGITPQVFLRDTCSGMTPLTQASNTCTPATYLISSPDGATPGNGASSYPAVAEGGTFVAFVSAAANLGANSLNAQVFEQAECLGATTCSFTAPILISTPDGTTLANTNGGPATNGEPTLSSDGRFVAFASTATNLGVPGGIQQIYVRDTCTNATTTTTSTTCAPSTTLVSQLNGVAGNGLSENPQINQNSTTTSVGQFVAFASTSSNLATNVANGVENIFVRNTCEGLTTGTACTPTTALASQPAGTSPASSNGSSFLPSISGDGHIVGFLSFANDLVPRDLNNLEDIFLALTSF